MSGIYETTEAPVLASMRLCGQERAVEACAELELVKSHRAAPAFEADIVSTWRDLPGQDIGAASGVTLEMKRDNGTLVQTIRGAAPAGEPIDISFDLGGDKISGLPRMRTNLLLEAEKNANGETLSRRSRLRLRTELKRRVVALRYRSSEITITMERGRVFAWPEDGRFLSQRVGQVLLQLENGLIEDFNSFAEALAGETGLAPGERSPEEIGRALLREDFGNPFPAQRYDLTDEATAREVLEKALGVAVDQVLANIQALRIGHPQGVKQMRVALRRFRSIIRIFKKSLPMELIKPLVDDAKYYGKKLGAGRDLDVFVEETLPMIVDAGLPGETEAEALACLERQADRLRQQERREGMALADDPAFAAFCVRLGLLVDQAPWAGGLGLHKPARKYAYKALDKALAKVEKTGADLAAAEPTARHPLRVELKKLRYGVQAFRPLYDKKDRKPYMAAMSALQDEFGVLNDAVVARDVVVMVASSDDGSEDIRALEAGAGYVVGWTQRGLNGQGDQVLARWQDFTAEKPFWRKASQC